MLQEALKLTNSKISGNSFESGALVPCLQLPQNVVHLTGSILIFFFIGDTTLKHTILKKAAAAALVTTLFFTLTACGSSSGSSDTNTTGDTTDAASETELLSGLHHVSIEIADYGTIELELDADSAPITVTNFITLTESGFYDGLTFHRIIEGFMMQGGDPSGNGTGGSGTTIKGEFAANGVDNPISHTRGTISMARSQAYDSASSQFFIMHEDGDFLDGQYAAFGHVTSGIEVVDAVCTSAEPTDNNGTIPAEAQPVITHITVVD